MIRVWIIRGVKFGREVESSVIKPCPKSTFPWYCSMHGGLAVIGEMVKFMQLFIVFILENSDHYSLIHYFGQKILHE
jgi:hypothetical protein